ncbi:hypothetical protein NHJ6243_009631 [Beauveria neobassiana]
MSFSITPRVISVLCLTVVSVAGQWSGNYNITSVPKGLAPADHCRIQSLNPANGVPKPFHPCTCTGGKVAADCNWESLNIIWNSVRDANCKCVPNRRSLVDEPESLKAYSLSQPNAVRQCICDPADPKGEAGADGLIVPAPNCWCPADSLKKNSGLSEAKEDQAVPETPPSGDAASVQKCRDDFRKSRMIPKNTCKYLMEKKPTEFSNVMQASIPNCTIPLLTEVCKGILQD